MANENDFRPPAGEIHEVASGVFPGYAARDAGESLSRRVRPAGA